MLLSHKMKYVLYELILSLIISWHLLIVFMSGPMVKDQENIISKLKDCMWDIEHCFNFMEQCVLLTAVLKPNSWTFLKFSTSVQFYYGTVNADSIFILSWEVVAHYQASFISDFMRMTIHEEIWGRIFFTLSLKWAAHERPVSRVS